MSSSSPDFEKLLNVLVAKDVQFVVIGGLAGIYHGHARVTYDIDICYSREKSNLEALVNVLKEVDAKLRGADALVVKMFKLDWRTLKSGLNFTFTTIYGDFDVLGEVSGVGGYDECLKGVRTGIVAGVEVQILSLDRLIEAKKAAGRPKDLDDLRALERLKNIMDRTGKQSDSGNHS
jgi:hypothetical protein